MVDKILLWLVLIVPVVLGLIVILVPSKSEDKSRHLRWRIGLGVSLLIYGGLAWWQQSRAERSAQIDRENAIRETATQVSAEVTKVVTQQYLAVIKEYETRTAQVQGSVTKQGKQLQRSMAETSSRNEAQVLLSHLSQVIEKLQDTLARWRADDAVARHKTPSGKNDPDYRKQRDDWRVQYGYSLRSTMIDAKSIRGQLRKKMPEARISQMGDGSKLYNAAAGEPLYMEDLAMIVSDLTDVHRRVSNLLAPSEE